MTKTISKEKLKEKSLKFQEALKKLQEEPKTPTQKILHENKEAILEARKKNISYPKIAQLIKETFDCKISPQTIRVFVKKHSEQNSS